MELIDAVACAAELRTLVDASDPRTQGAERSLHPSAMAAVLRGRPEREVFVWVARSQIGEAALVGMVALVRAIAGVTTRWSIGWLVVSPAWRRRGIALTLVSTAVRHAGARGANVVHAETLRRWPDAVAFWEAARLAAVGHVATLPESGESRKTAEG